MTLRRQVRGDYKRIFPVLFAEMGDVGFEPLFVGFCATGASR